MSNMNDTLTDNELVEEEDEKDIKTSLLIENDLKYYELLVSEENNYLKNDIIVKEESATSEDNRRKHIKLEVEEPLSSFDESIIRHNKLYTSFDLQPIEKISVKEEIVVKEEYESSENYTYMNSEESVPPLGAYTKETSNSTLNEITIKKEEIDTFDSIQRHNIKLEIEDSLLSFDAHIYKESFEEAITMKEDIKLETGSSISSLDGHSLDEELIIKDELIEDNLYEEDDSDEIINKKNKTNDVIFQCAICSEEYANRRTLLKHIKGHNEACTENDDKTTDFMCSICNKVFLYKTNLNRHQQIHKNIEFQCTDCQKVFKRKDHLKKHIYHHCIRKNPTKEYPCSICNKKLATPSSLLEHKKIHLGIKDQKCEICSKVFTHKGQLKQHLKVHTNIRKYTCSYCNQKFKHKTHWIEHEKIHTGTRDFQCEVCSKKFIRKRHLESHKKVHSKPKRDFQCSECDKVYMCETILQRHMKKVHNDMMAKKQYQLCPKASVLSVNFMPVSRLL